MTRTNKPLGALAAQARRIRAHVVRMVCEIRVGYLLQGLGAADLFTTLYFDELNLDPTNPTWPERDRFILSTAHNTALLYATFAERGLIALEALDTYTRDGSPLEVNASERMGPIVEATCGSLGQGLSVAVGMALSLRRRGSAARVYVVLGDGELQEGQVWEAALSAGSHGLDNLCLIVDRNYLQVEGHTDKVVIMDPIDAKFAAFGWDTALIDGNDIGQVTGALDHARRVKGRPSAIVAQTRPGAGVPFLDGQMAHVAFISQEDAARALAHLESRRMSRASNVEGMGGFRDIRYADALKLRSYGAALLASAHADPRIVVLGADLSQPTETAAFRDTLPDRFFMMGIQEANMIGAAGGMARSGDIPFCHSFSVFVTRRVYDQVAMQVAYPKLPVKIVGFIPGLATELGVSHQAIDDLALMRALPNMAVIEPSGPEQVGAAVAEALAYNGPVFLRLAINRAKDGDATPLQPLKLGVGQMLREGADVAILAIGGMVAEALQAADLLAAQGVSASVANMASLKPLDTGLVRELAGRHRLLVTAENHSVIGALGSAVAEALAEGGAGVRLVRVGVQDQFAEGGTTAYLLDKYGLSAPHIAARAKAALASA